MLFLCCIWALLFGAALTCLIVSALPGYRAVPPAPAQTAGIPPSILGMTPASRAALGKCAAPDKLRNMHPGRIWAMLATAQEANETDHPSRTLVDTWPQQAAMLWAGDIQGLQTWQRAWLARMTTPPSAPPPQAGTPYPMHERVRLRKWRNGWLLAALLLLMLSLLSFLSVGANCAGKHDTPCSAQLILSTDMLFGYNESSPQGHAAMAKEYGRLYRLFGAFRKVELLALEGHTDPIGSTEENRRLGRDRTATVQRMITRLVAEPALSANFKSSFVPPVPADAGPHTADIGIWTHCFSEYHLALSNKDFAPLRNLRREANPDNRPDCDTAIAALSPSGQFPACGSPYDKTIAESSIIYALRADNFRKLTACLAPMRYVAIKFRYGAD